MCIYIYIYIYIFISIVLLSSALCCFLAHFILINLSNLANQLKNIFYNLTNHDNFIYSLKL